MAKLGKVLISKENIDKKVQELAEIINEDYKNDRILLVGILKGAVIFLADLIRHLDIDIDLDFMAISSYGSATKTSGVVRILKDLDEPIEDRHVLLVEDITDTGLTLSYLTRNLLSRRPKSLEICSLLRKKTEQQLPVAVKYNGFDIDGEFVVGYGLDFDQQYRQLRDIYLLEVD